MLTSVILFVVLIGLVVDIILSEKRDKENKHRIDVLVTRRINAEIIGACAQDNENFYQDCLVRLAAKVFGKEIPAYKDGERWRPGDEIIFKTVDGNVSCYGEVQAHIDDEGMMQDRCPVIVRVLDEQTGEDVFYTVDQITDVELARRPEHFQDLVKRNKKNLND